MSVKKILESDWSDYDNKKKKAEDRDFFACTESWEVDYLVNKILEHHPYILITTIQLAIKSCCNIIGSPHPRVKFVECVASKLGISLI